jgi:hypothetical protein
VSHAQLWLSAVFIEQHRSTPILRQKPSQMLSSLDKILWIFIEDNQNLVGNYAFIEAVYKSFKKRQSANTIK